MINKQSHIFNPVAPPKNEQDARVKKSAEHVYNEVEAVADGLEALDNSPLDTNPEFDEVHISYSKPALINGKIVAGTYDGGNVSAATITGLRSGSIDATYSRTITEHGADRSVTQHAHRYVPDTVEVNDLADGMMEYSFYIDPDAFGKSPIFFP